MIEPKLITIESKKLVGLQVDMNLINNKTRELWESFIPLKPSINHKINLTEMISMSIYPEMYFESFNPATEFLKCACIEVSSFKNQIKKFHTYVIPNSLFAVFKYKGHPKNGTSFFQQIFTEWLPRSGFHLDNRPHFEVLGQLYKHESSDSEEDIYIPIRRNK